MQRISWSNKCSYVSSIVAPKKGCVHSLGELTVLQYSVLSVCNVEYFTIRLLTGNHCVNA